MRKVTNMRIETVDYPCDGQIVRGSNLMYRVDGKPSSSRVPWVAVSPTEETARVERLLRRVAAKTGKRSPGPNRADSENAKP